MTQLSLALCPHCEAANTPGAAFCQSCGKAISTGGGGPRLVHGNDFAATTLGREAQSEALKKTAKKASGALLAVAIIQAAVGTLLISTLPRNVPEDAKTQLMVIVYGTAAAFF